MDPVAIIIGCSWIFVGALCVALAIPLIRGRVKPNALYGVRFRQSFQSDEAWFAINRFGGQRLATWSLPMIAVGLATLFLPLQSHAGLALVMGFGPLVLVLIPMLQSWHYARHFHRKA